MSHHRQGPGRGADSWLLVVAVAVTAVVIVILLIDGTAARPPLATDAWRGLLITTLVVAWAVYLSLALARVSRQLEHLHLSVAERGERQHGEDYAKGYLAGVAGHAPPAGTLRSVN